MRVWNIPVSGFLAPANQLLNVSSRGWTRISRYFWEFSEDDLVRKAQAYRDRIISSPTRVIAWIHCIRVYTLVWLVIHTILVLAVNLVGSQELVASSGNGSSTHDGQPTSYPHFGIDQDFKLSWRFLIFDIGWGSPPGVQRVRSMADMHLGSEHYAYKALD